MCPYMCPYTLSVLTCDPEVRGCLMCVSYMCPYMCPYIVCVLTRVLVSLHVSLYVCLHELLPHLKDLRGLSWHVSDRSSVPSEVRERIL